MQKDTQKVENENERMAIKQKLKIQKRQKYRTENRNRMNDRKLERHIQSVTERTKDRR